MPGEGGRSAGFPVARAWLEHPWAWPLALSLAFLLAIAFIGVQGEFPLNDDFAYARSTLTYLETGRFERLAWTYTPIITHVAVGVVVSKIFGFSFAALRCSTLVFGWLGLLGAYVLCRQYAVSRPLCALSAATLAFNPVYLSLSFTFMTDVPFVALVIWSEVCFVAWFARAGSRDKSRHWLLLCGVVLGLLATLSRQTGLSLFAALGLASLLTLRRRQMRLVAAIVVGVAVLFFAFELYVQATAESDHYFTLIRAVRREFGVHSVAYNVVSVSAYLGVFLLPVVAALSCTRPAFPGGRWRPLACWALLVAALGLYGIARLRMGLPPGRNIIMDLGIGPIALRGSELMPHASKVVWWLVALAGFLTTALASAWLGHRLWAVRARLWPPEAKHAQMYFPLLFVLLFLLPHLPREPLFDRYLLTVMPSLMAMLLAGSASKPFALPVTRALSGAVSGLALSALAAFSLLATHDYMAHHRTRWALIDSLRADGVSTLEVDGGFEFLGWYNYDPQPVGKLKKATYRYWLDDDAYVVTLSPSLPDYSHLRSLSHTRYLPPGSATLYVLHRNDP